MKPHKHAELIKAWADGAEIQWYDSSPREHCWKDCPEYFDWGATCQFRIKPEPKPDVVYETNIKYDFAWNWVNTTCGGLSNLKLTFDGETGKLKSAEVL